MPIDINNISPAELEENFYRLAHECNDADEKLLKAKEDYEIIKDNSDRIFAVIATEQPGKSTAEKERLALVTEEWKRHLESLGLARKEYKTAQSLHDTLVRLWKTYRSIMSMRNTHMKMGA